MFEGPDPDIGQVGTFLNIFNNYVMVITLLVLSQLKPTFWLKIKQNR
jgi:hypothetical protein